MDREQHKGHRNYFTWAVYNWVSNDPGLSSTVENICQAYDIEEAATATRDLITESAVAQIPGGGSLARDVTVHALYQVDWIEVARDFGGKER